MQSAARFPIVANQTVDRIELAVLQDFSRAHMRPPHDQLQHAVVFWRAADLVDAGLELLHGQVLHVRNPTACERER